MRSGRLRGGIQQDADLNMINGGPGLQIPSSSCCQCASDRPLLKVASAITAHTLHLFPSMRGRSLGVSKPGQQYKESKVVYQTRLKFVTKTYQPIRGRKFYFETSYSSVTLQSVFFTLIRNGQEVIHTVSFLLSKTKSKCLLDKSGLWYTSCVTQQHITQERGVKQDHLA